VRSLAVLLLLLFAGLAIFAVARTRAGSPEPLRRRRWVRVAPVAALALLLLGTAAWWLRPRLVQGAVRPGAEVIAVLPFSTSGQGIDLPGEGLVDLLARDLDGVEGIRVIDPRTALYRWRRSGGDALDLPAALHVGRDLGAGSVLTGTAVAAGGEVAVDLAGVFADPDPGDGAVLAYTVRLGPPAADAADAVNQASYAHVHGDLLYVTYYKEGIRVLSIKNPHKPVEIAYYDTYPTTANGCFGGIYAGCWGAHPWNLDKVFVSDLDSGGYILRLTAVPNTFTAKATTIKPGNTLEMDMTYNNAATTPLNGFGFAWLTAVNSSPLLFSFLSEAKLLTASQSINHKLKIPIPSGLPNMTLDFTSYSGTFQPLTLSETHKLTVQIKN